MIFTIPDELKQMIENQYCTYQKLLWFDHLGRQGIDYKQVIGVSTSPVSGNAVGVWLANEQTNEQWGKSLDPPFPAYSSLFGHKTMEELRAEQRFEDPNG